MDIHTCYGQNEDGSINEEAGLSLVCISYLGPVITKWNIEEVINDEEFFIGCGEGMPQVSLLDALIEVE